VQPTIEMATISESITQALSAILTRSKIVCFGNKNSEVVFDG